MDETTPRWLIVVQPSQQALYGVLRRSLKEESPVAVIYDRRTRERRRRRPASARDRRRLERRRRGPDGWLYECEVLKVVPTDAAAGTPAAPAPQSCPECGMEVEFEMPRFPQPPARVVVETVHAGAQHYVEIHAFTASGRPLLAQRNLAWPRGRAR